MEELLKVTMRNLSYHKMRTALTMLGIVIGIGAIVALVSLSGALTNTINEQFEQLGSKKFIVAPKHAVGFGPSAGSAAKLTDRDVDLIKKIKGVKHAVPVLFKNLPVKYKETTASLSVTGIPLDETNELFKDIQGYEIAEGRILKTGERSAVVIGSDVAENVFREKVRLRSKISIFNHDVKVVGILEQVGNAQDDKNILMDIDFLQEITNSSDEISFIFGSAFSDVEHVVQRVEDKLNDKYNDDVFSVYTMKQLIKQISSIFSIISLVLLGIASISLVVAGIGIMNTMLMSVIERTKEIGVMKAIGATDYGILLMFLTESAIVGLLGGAIGVVLGYSVSFAFTQIGSAVIGITLKISIDILLIIGAIGFSAFVGMLSGTYPAYRASRLSPVEALRYE